MACDVTFHSECHSATLHSKISFSWCPVSWILHRAPLGVNIPSTRNCDGRMKSKLLSIRVLSCPVCVLFLCLCHAPSADSSTNSTVSRVQCSGKSILFHSKHLNSVSVVGCRTSRSPNERLHNLRCPREERSTSRQLHHWGKPGDA